MYFKFQVSRNFLIIIPALSLDSLMVGRILCSMQGIEGGQNNTSEF